MTALVLVLHLVSTVATLGILAGFLLLRHAVVGTLGHSEVDRITATIGEVQLTVDRKMDELTSSIGSLHMDMETFRRELRMELDSLHERLEFLEQRDRERRV